MNCSQLVSSCWIFGRGSRTHSVTGLPFTVRCKSLYFHIRLLDVTGHVFDITFIILTIIWLVVGSTGGATGIYSSWLDLPVLSMGSYRSSEQEVFRTAFICSTQLSSEMEWCLTTVGSQEIPSISRLLVACSDYLCLSLIVLLNMLIAVMNSTFELISVIKESLWYIESVNSIAWISQSKIKSWI